MKWAFSVLVILLSLFLNACGGDDDFNRRFVDPSQVRFVNLVPNAPTLSYDLNGTLFATVSYAQSSGLRTVSPGSFEAVVSHFDAAGTTEVIIDTNESLGTETNRDYSVLVTGSLAAPTLSVIDVEEAGEIAAGSSEIHFFNGSTLTSGLDIYLSGDLTSASINGLTPTSLAVNASSSISTVDSGERRILVTASGDDSVIYDGGVVELEAEVRTLLAVADSFGVGGGVRMIRINATSASGFIDERLPTSFRVANMVADIAAVDINLDEAPAFANLAFGTVSAFEELDTNEHLFAATLVSQPAAVLQEEQRRLIAGESRTLVLAGTAATGDVQGRFLTDTRRPVDTGAQLRIINAAADAGNLDIYVANPDALVTSTTPVLSDFTLLTNGSLFLEGGEYDVSFTEPNESTVLVGPDRITLTNGGIYSLFLVDAEGGGVPGGIILVDDTP